MKRSTKAALLSGLIFPGTGHLYLKRYVHGAILCMASATAIYFIVSAIVTTALEVVEKIQNGNGAVALDMATITDLVSQQSSGSEQPMNIATVALVVCWVIGIVDSYRQGRAQEKLDDVEGEKES
ncbi:hypothetical protein DFR30_1074 [Thiogranum longum]|uniref:Uncharacterized protein n=1 Tax=Thiogranum longum TaxID=1537524 RepID=A0A4R1H7M1_9GAMM|nr:hypothetical protein [Thiogranum longum]TCK17824.1 hypothetical protein DFR30_1074 [Thiogranum longum]